MSVLSFCDGLPWILLTADIRSTYMILVQTYTWRRLWHLFLRKEGLAITCVSLSSSGFQLSWQEMAPVWHGTESWFAHRWKRAKFGRRTDSSWDNLILDRDPHTKAETGNLVQNKPRHSSVPRTRQDLAVSCSIWDPICFLSVSDWTWWLSLARQWKHSSPATFKPLADVLSQQQWQNVENLLDEAQKKEKSASLVSHVAEGARAWRDRERDNCRTVCFSISRLLLLAVWPQ